MKARWPHQAAVEPPEGSGRPSLGAYDTRQASASLRDPATGLQSDRADATRPCVTPRMTVKSGPASAQRSGRFRPTSGSACGDRRHHPLRVVLVAGAGSACGTVGDGLRDSARGAGTGMGPRYQPRRLSGGEEPRAVHHVAGSVSGQVATTCGSAVTRMSRRTRPPSARRYSPSASSRRRARTSSSSATW